MYAERIYYCYASIAQFEKFGRLWSCCGWLELGVFVDLLRMNHAPSWIDRVLWSTLVTAVEVVNRQNEQSSTGMN